MPTILKWSNQLSVRIPAIDGQHRQLFSIINRLAKAHQDGSIRDIILIVIKDMMAYSSEHFRLEEDLMIECDFPLFKTHRLEHQKYTDRIEDFITGYEEGRDSLMVEMLVFLKDWWLKHISQSDIKYANWVESQKPSSCVISAT